MPPKPRPSVPQLTNQHFMQQNLLVSDSKQGKLNSWISDNIQFYVFSFLSFFAWCRDVVISVEHRCIRKNPVLQFNSAFLVFHSNMWLRQAVKKDQSIIGKDYTVKMHFLHATGRKNANNDDEDFLNKISVFKYSASDLLIKWMR